ncbi:MAG: LuxR C-terminal-related transcriptional regulator [Phycisphaerae bacterium]
MYPGESSSSACFDLNQLIDLTGALLELTTDMNSLARVPEVLSRGLDLGPLSFSLVDIHTPGKPTILALETYGNPVLCQEFASESYLRQDVLTLSMADRAAPTPPAPDPFARCANGLKCPFTRATYCGQCRQTILSRHVDKDHRLILMINLRPQETAIPPATMEALHLVLGHLAKSLHVLVSCQHYPSCLGAPFTTLTEREWTVLCGLNSEAGEKQLADRFAMSPHTLHSHIKSIYRKLEVQGRLSLLQRFRHALRDYRLGALCSISIPEQAPRQALAS